MTKSFLIVFVFLIRSPFLGFSQITSDQLVLNDSIWRYTHSDTFQEIDGTLINYYDSLALHYDFIEDCHVGQDILDAENRLTRKQRILPNGFSYAIDYYNGVPVAGGYGNNKRSAYLQWHLNGQLQFIEQYLLNDDSVEGVKDGISILFDEKGNILWYGVYSNDIIVIMQTKEIQK